jgi:hypothetical protein
MKSSVDRDNNYCHYVILRNAGFAITLNYHPAGCDVVMVVYRLLCGLSAFFSVLVDGLGQWAGGGSSKRRVHSTMRGGVIVISTAQSHCGKQSLLSCSPTTIEELACFFQTFFKSALTHFKSPARSQTLVYPHGKARARAGATGHCATSTH